MPLLTPTLKQLATRIVLLEELPTCGLPPKDMREDFQALTYLPEDYTMIETTTKFAGLDGEELKSQSGIQVSFEKIISYPFWFTILDHAIW